MENVHQQRTESLQFSLHASRHPGRCSLPGGQFLISLHFFCLSIQLQRFELFELGSIFFVGTKKSATFVTLFGRFAPYPRMRRT